MRVKPCVIHYLSLVKHSVIKIKVLQEWRPNHWAKSSSPFVDVLWMTPPIDSQRFWSQSHPCKKDRTESTRVCSHQRPVTLPEMENNKFGIITQTFVNGIHLHVLWCYTKAKANYNRAQICEPQMCHDLVDVIPLPLTYNSLVMPCKYILIVPHCTSCMKAILKTLW